MEKNNSNSFKTEDPEDLTGVYLKPKKDPQVRIGRSFQALIPINKDLTNLINHGKELDSYHDNFIEKASIENSKSIKKQKIEEN